MINSWRTCAARVTVSWSMSVSVKSHLTSGVSVHPENTATYSAGNGGQIFCGVFSGTAAPLQRSSTVLLKAIRTFGQFPAESTHVHYEAVVSSSVEFREFPLVMPPSKVCGMNS